MLLNPVSNTSTRAFYKWFRKKPSCRAYCTFERSSVNEDGETSLLLTVHLHVWKSSIFQTFLEGIKTTPSCMLYQASRTKDKAQMQHKEHQQKRHGISAGGTKPMDSIQRYKNFHLSSITQLLKFYPSGNRVKFPTEVEGTSSSFLEMVLKGLYLRWRELPCRILPYINEELHFSVLGTVTFMLHFQIRHS